MYNYLGNIKEFGVEKVDNDIFFQPTEKEYDTSTVFNDTDPKSILLKKEVKCLICSEVFKTLAQKVRRSKLINIDTDLRPTYDTIDTVAYDIISCPKCGFTSTTSSFNKITVKEKNNFLENTQSSFVKTEEEDEDKYAWTYDEAINRYKLAVYVNFVKKGTIGERSFLYMKIAWLYRAVRNKEREYFFLHQAYEGYKIAFAQETFPIMGNDEPTFKLLNGEIARRLGRVDEAKQWIGSLLVDRNTSEKLRERGKDIKNLIVRDLKE